MSRGRPARSVDDAARLVDDKWGATRYFQIDAVGKKILARMGFAEDDGDRLRKDNPRAGVPPDDVFPTSGEAEDRHDRQ
ncbi:MAG: hypothetical protein R3F14_04665 [Polyangiaceae bacterium]